MGNCCCSTGGSLKADRDALLKGDKEATVWDNLRGKTILRNFRAPGFYSSWSVSYFSGQGSLAVSNERIVAHGSKGFQQGKGRLVNMPWGHPSVQHVQFKVAGSGNKRCLVITVDPHRTNPERSGEIEYHFEMGADALKWLQRIQALQQSTRLANVSVVGVPIQKG